MCGITGFCDFSKKLNIEHLSKANAVLQHRGPDSGNEEVYDARNATIGFGHRRLSILDVSVNGSQPILKKYEKNLLNGGILSILIPIQK